MFLNRLWPLARAIIVVAALLAFAIPSERSAQAASLAAVACGAPDAQPQSLTIGAVRCDYQPDPGFHPTHDGGPWLDIDLLHESLADLKAIHDGTSGKRLWTDATDPTADGPLLPPLDLVHAQICLSDPSVAYNVCPNNYPANAAAQPYGYALNPNIIPLLSQGLANLRKAGLKVILRFTYNYPCNAAAAPASPAASDCVEGPDNDAPMNVILTHMRQLAPVVQANSDVIYALQAGFIGQWGEWHNSTNGNDAPVKHNEFLDQFTQLFAPFVQMEVRRPYVPLDYALHRFGNQDLSSVLATGLGMHDDEFGSNLDDAGTFSPEEPTDPGAVNYSTCTLRQTAALLSQAYTMTGETSAPYNFSDAVPCGSDVAKPTNFLGFAADYSLSTLQLVFAEAAWQNWVNTGVYNTIIDSIGPHLSLVSMQVEPSGAGAQLTLTLQNTGWSAVPPPGRPLWLLISRGDIPVLVKRLPINLSAVKPGKPTSFSILLQLPNSTSPGNYVASLAAPDRSLRLAADPRYALLFENSGAPDVATGLNVIASFTVQQ